MYFARGTCTNGSSCEYCHLPHVEKPTNLDKRQREMVCKLSLAQLLATVKQCMKSRAEATGIQEAATEILSIMEAWALAAMAKPKAEAAELTPGAKSSSKFRYFLSKMSFRAQVCLVMRHPDAEPWFAEEMNKALDAMRSQISDSRLQLSL
eukprot:gb/GFBE01004915.1/.p1 GENE.gb/GFBE01004915.1/~~gb/GFBE01004915.1/.p1  ORF type:complete len:151 (+),score=43.50 gb/GFBE01004915.1/:1-453(+)